jgi:uncharacterized repeat protein (TIGR02543 family)
MKTVLGPFLPVFAALLALAAAASWHAGHRPGIRSGAGAPAPGTLAYDRNGSAYGFVPVPSAAAPGQAVPVQGNAGDLYRPGCVFKGWNTRADGSGLSYRPGDRIVPPGAGVVLYARWSPGPSHPGIFRNPEGEQR